MAMVSTENRDHFFKQLSHSIEQNLNKDECGAVQAFAKEYFRTYPLDELEGHQSTDVYGSVYWWWSFIHNREPEEPKITIFNPNLDEHGWLSPYTVVCVLQDDMPFAMESIRLELTRRNINIHTVHNASLSVLRNEIGDVAEMSASMTPLIPSDNQTHQIENLICFEIALHSDPKEIEVIELAIKEVVSDVKLVVNDFDTMKMQIAQILSQLEHLDISSINEDIEESKEFLKWLLEDHFTFLGYTEFYFSEEAGSCKLKEVVDTRLGLLKLRSAEEITVRDEYSGEAMSTITPQLVGFSKSSVRSKIHRDVYPDYFIVKCYDNEGKHVGEYRFMGLYTADVYQMSPTLIPILRQKIQRVLEYSELSENSQDGKSLLQVLRTFPRDEIFQSTTQELFETTLSVMRIKERRQVRLFVRKDRFGAFVSCIVYMPRDIYNTKVRCAVQDALTKAFNATAMEFTTYFSESTLARTYLNFKVDPSVDLNFDVVKLEAMVVEITRSWDDLLLDAMVEAHGEEKGTLMARDYNNAFPAAYKADFEARYAVKDINVINTLTAQGEIAMGLYHRVGEDRNLLRFKLFRLDEILALSDMIPILENMGLRVLGEHPYGLEREDGKKIWIHDFQILYAGDIMALDQVKANFEEAFDAIWVGEAESDGFNKLIMGTNLDWREVALLRAYSSYMKQINFNFSKDSIIETLCRHLDITKNIVSLFKTSFDPQMTQSGEFEVRSAANIEKHILDCLEGVDNLNEDTIVRRFLDLIRGTLRTNFFQKTEQGNPKPCISFKFQPTAIPDMPLPAPMYEIFVCSPRVEGVHLRGGKVARGGLRWSDRKEDFRTEILGLVKAQQVKNAVIVPVGAKGGFVPKKIPDNATRDEIQAEGIACYRLFIQSLLDLSDNLKDGKVVRAVDVVRKDDDDTYLVVAADKGTATFSDIANELSENSGFWLGDAFASGGSVGYDHKKMGITAKGAWVAVQRHFREMNLNIQEEDFTVIGIGDMAGDVFGNGMLLSEHIQLVAAFNHMHIFIDPNPDSALTYSERQRLFDMPRSSWEDYNTELLSEGGGIFLRSAKSICISKQIAERFDIKAEKLTPTQLITAILKARVDLIWNGVIGTYINANSETHSDVGDKANDVLRVNGEDIQCRVIGEGGNLGITQLGRVEYCLNSGVSDTDFIDNAGGVDCSDHEVNIKILLNEVVANGDMTTKQRNKILASMTDEVSELVLHNNYRQVQAISLAEGQGVGRIGEYQRYISELESQGKLDRLLEFLPDDETITDRKIRNQGLTRPELSVLLSYSKAILKEDLASSTIAEDDYMASAVETAFPSYLVENFHEQIHHHRLKKEIVATQVANELVNHMGFTFIYRLAESTGASPSKIAKAYMTVRSVLGVDDVWAEIEALDYQIPAQVQLDLMSRLVRLVRRSSRWFLRNRRAEASVAGEIERFAPSVKTISDNLSGYLQGELSEDWQRSFDSMLNDNVPESIARYVAGANNLYSALGVVEVSQQSDTPVERVAKTYYTLGNVLDLHWITNEIVALKVDNHWQALARENLLDDIDWQQRALTAAVLQTLGADGDIDTGIESWAQQHIILVERWRNMMNELRGSETRDFAIYSVALRDLLDLVQSSEHQGGDDACH